MGAMEGRERAAWDVLWWRAERRRRGGWVAAYWIPPIVLGLAVMLAMSMVFLPLCSLCLSGFSHDWASAWLLGAALGFGLLPIAAGLVSGAAVHRTFIEQCAGTARESGLCVGCDYDLRSTGECRAGWRRCPECGLEQPVSAASGGPRGAGRGAERMSSLGPRERAWNRRWAKAVRRRRGAIAATDWSMPVVVGLVAMVVVGFALVPFSFACLTAVGDIKSLEGEPIVLVLVGDSVLLVAAGGIYAFALRRAIAQQSADHGRTSGLCADCDYDLRAVAESNPGWRRCPECGLEQPVGLRPSGTAPKP